MSRSPFLTLSGAVAAEDGRSVAHYGGFLREQRALATGRALVHRGDLAVIELSGSDRLRWIDSLTTQRITGMQPGEARETLLLSPEGRVEHAFTVVETGELALLITSAERANDLCAWLDRMRFMLDVRVKIAAERHVLAWWGSEPDALPGLIGDAIQWPDPWGNPPEWGTSYRAEGGEAPDAWCLQLAVVNEAVAEAVADAGARGDVGLAGLDALTALRIAAWRPDIDHDVDERTIPHELDWLRSAVHLNKGCYRGQETVAKVHNLGHPPRRLAFLNLDGSDGELPAEDTLLHLAGDESKKPVGRLTSVAVHYEEGPIGLALLKRSLPSDAALVLPLPGGADATVSVTEIVSPDAGHSFDVPRMPRLGRKR